MTTPFPFQSAAVLTAAQMNAITTLATSTKTASHTLTIADVSTRVIMNSASATTITVNTSIFGASDVVEILNIGAGVCTVTAGTCTVGTSGSLALAQNAGGTLTFISAGVSVFQANGVTATPSGLVFLTGGTVTSSTSANFDNVFSATYDNYRIIISDITSSGSEVGVNMRMRVGGVTNSAAEYDHQEFRIYSTGTEANGGANGATEFYLWVSGTSPANHAGACIIDITQPFLAKPTTALVTSHTYDAGITAYFYNTIGNTHTVSSSFDGFTIFQTTTTTAYKYKIYGYSNS